MRPLRATPLAALLLAATLPSAAQEKAFRMGPVDLLAMAASMPVLDLPEKVETPPGTVTNRELRATVESFLEKEIWKPLEGANRKAAGAGRRASDYTAPQANSGFDTLAVVAMAAIANAIGWATTEPARDAARCRDFLSARGEAIRSFLREVPESDAPASEAALERWERLSRGVRSYPACAGSRSP